MEEQITLNTYVYFGKQCIEREKFHSVYEKLRGAIQKVPLRRQSVTKPTLFHLSLDKVG